MKLLRTKIVREGGGSGILNGLDVVIRRYLEADVNAFQPLCVIGPNGSGKSQFLQLIAEFFQAALHAAVPDEERREVDPSSEFELHYLFSREGNSPIEVQLHGKPASSSAAPRQVLIRTREGEDEWSEWEPVNSSASKFLPPRVVAYTSGENETLSLPFLASRMGYAHEIAEMALPGEPRIRRAKRIRNTKAKTSGIDTVTPLLGLTPRLMLIDYSTHLEVLVANLLLGSQDQRKFLLGKVKLAGLRSMRCVVSLNHKAVRNGVRKGENSTRKGVQLTPELEHYIDILKQGSTTWSYDKSIERYVFDFWIDEETRKAFRSEFDRAFDLYLALHKLSLLNVLAISKPARDRFETDVTRRRFASRLPEPPEQDKVFRFEELTFHPVAKENNGEVDYVSLSDGEHQLVQMLGVFAMLDEPNVLFLLDEPDSHLNPEWRVKFMTDLAALPTSSSTRESSGGFSAAQEVFITTHAPFVTSDTPRNRTMVFKRVEKEDGRVEIKIQRPNIQTFGAKYDEILAECFGVFPPISAQPRAMIDELLNSSDPDYVSEGLSKLGPSVERVKVVDHLQQLKDE